MFDCAAWQLRRRQLGVDEDDLVLFLLWCMDAIPAFKRKGISLMPAESMLLNLPPWLRAKTKYIMLHFLMPSTLKERAQKKYFDYMITMDLNPLATTGIPHPTIVGRIIRVAIFATPLDLPGKDKLFWLRGS